MKLFRHIAFSAMLTLGAFAAVTYSSCTKDPCKDVSCLNGGTCASGNCTCKTGYEGTDCGTLSRTKFVGTYVGTEQCTIGSDAYSVVLSASSQDLQLTYTNVYNQGFTATCTMTGTNTFSFTGSSNTTSYSGTGTLTNNTITISYQISNSATSTSNSCTFTGTK